jgi:hypothetical protein
MANNPTWPSFWPRTSSLDLLIANELSMAISMMQVIERIAIKRFKAVQVLLRQDSEHLFYVLVRRPDKI